MNSIVDGYCLGNIGSVRKVCSNTHIPLESGPNRGYTPIEVDVAGVKKGPPKVMELRCPLLDDYFFELTDFGFTFKIDYEYDYFTSASQRCELVNEENEAI